MGKELIGAGDNLTPRDSSTHQINQPLGNACGSKSVVLDTFFEILYRAESFVSLKIILLRTISATASTFNKEKMALTSTQNNSRM